MDSSEKLKEILADLKAGKMVIVTDETDREDEGDLVMAAEFATKDAINFMAKEGRGLICAPISEACAERLELPLMVENNSDPFKTKFTVSVDYRHGTSTGISMYDRALTIRKLADLEAKGSDFARPGHVFPLIAHADGLKVRRGHTEATLELLKLAGLRAVGVICEIVNDDGLMARKDDLQRFSEKHELKMIHISEISA